MSQPPRGQKAGTTAHPPLPAERRRATKNGRDLTGSGCPWLDSWLYRFSEEEVSTHLSCATMLRRPSGPDVIAVIEDGAVRRIGRCAHRWLASAHASCGAGLAGIGGRRPSP
jgi:hypothetical protein